MSAQKPIILFVPGAWIHLAMYSPFLTVLRSAGYSVHTTTYPSREPLEPSTADVAADSAAIRRTTLLPLVEAGKDVVIVMHSYGGMPGSVAATGLGVVERKASGQSGGVVGLVFLSAFVLAEGASVADAQGGSLPAWVAEDNPAPGLSMPLDAMNIFSADVDSSHAKAMAEELVPHATLALKSPSPKPAWADAAFHGRLAYIVCTEDQAIPKIGQQVMMQLTGQPWIVKELVGSHNAPFMLKEHEAAQMVQGFIETFVGEGTLDGSGS